MKYVSLSNFHSPETLSKQELYKSLHHTENAILAVLESTEFEPGYFDVEKLLEEIKKRFAEAHFLMGADIFKAKPKDLDNKQRAWLRARLGEYAVKLKRFYAGFHMQLQRACQEHEAGYIRNRFQAHFHRLNELFEAAAPTEQSSLNVVSYHEQPHYACRDKSSNIANWPLDFYWNNNNFWLWQGFIDGLTHQPATMWACYVQDGYASGYLEGEGARIIAQLAYRGARIGINDFFYLANGTAYHFTQFAKNAAPAITHAASDTVKLTVRFASDVEGSMHGAEQKVAEGAQQVANGAHQAAKEFTNGAGHFLKAARADTDRLDCRSLAAVMSCLCHCISHCCHDLGKLLFNEFSLTILGGGGGATLSWLFGNAAKSDSTPSSGANNPNPMLGTKAPHEMHLHGAVKGTIYGLSALVAFALVPRLLINMSNLFLDLANKKNVGENLLRLMAHLSGGVGGFLFGYRLKEGGPHFGAGLALLCAWFFETLLAIYFKKKKEAIYGTNFVVAKNWLSSDALMKIYEASPAQFEKVATFTYQLQNIMSQEIKNIKQAENILVRFVISSLNWMWNCDFRMCKKTDALAESDLALKELQKGNLGSAMQKAPHRSDLTLFPVPAEQKEGEGQAPPSPTARDLNEDPRTSFKLTRSRSDSV